eukprot:COSAG01_NODE_8481_length_2771_cov_1.532186_5_plen_122_part_00
MQEQQDTQAMRDAAGYVASDIQDAVAEEMLLRDAAGYVASDIQAGAAAAAAATMEKLAQVLGLPPLPAPLARKWVMAVVAQFLMALAVVTTWPLMPFIEFRFFNDDHPCVTGSETGGDDCQ